MSGLNPRILVVDDDVEIGALLVRYLGGHGFDVATATSGAELRAAMGGDRIDLLLLDLGLPDEDGQRCFATCTVAGKAQSAATF